MRPREWGKQAGHVGKEHGKMERGMEGGGEGKGAKYMSPSKCAGKRLSYLWETIAPMFEDTRIWATKDMEEMADTTAIRDMVVG